MLVASNVKMSGCEKIKVNRNQVTEFFGEHIRQFHLKNNISNQEVSRLSRAKQWQRNVQKSVLYVLICFFR